MHRPLILLAVALATAGLNAQCLTVSGTPVTLVPTSIYTPDDEGLSAPLPLGFAFPIGGGTFTHVAIESNGVMYLTNGGAAVGATGFGFQDMAGSIGDSPRVAAYWADLEGVNAGYGVFMDTSVAGECKVTWANVNEYFQPGMFTVQATLHSSGQVDFSVPAGLAPQSFQATIGASAANGLFGSSSDLSSGPTSLIASLYEDFFAPVVIDIANRTTSILPVGPGYLAVTTCSGASNSSYGAGCYSLSSGFYQEFPDAVAANAGLQGNALLLTRIANGYVPIWVSGGAALFVPPTGAAVSMAPDDDGDTLVTPSVPFSIPGGSVASLTVSHNGIITCDTTGNNSFDYSPTGAELVTAAGRAFYPGWHDWNDNDVSTGSIKTEEVGGTLYITWDNVDNYPIGIANTGTMQAQLNLASGSVTFVWTAIDTSTASTYGTAYVVGYKGFGAITDPGSISLATQLPAVVPDVLPLTLSASPDPISTPSSGTVVTYTVDGLPALAPGVYVGMLIFSGGQVAAPGLDLGFIGAPGCAALVASLDLTIALVGFSPTQSSTLAIPAGIPPGTTVFAQAAGLMVPNSLPNGQNAFGLTTSNGIKTYVNQQ